MSALWLPVSPPRECRSHAEEGPQVWKDKIKNYFSNRQMFNICSITGDDGSFGLQCLVSLSVRFGRKTFNSFV